MEIKFDEDIEMKDNAMLRVRPELFEQWDFVKNDELGLDVYNITKGSKKKVWWICPRCGSSYDMEIFRRSKNRNCPYCAGKRVNHTNSLASLFPELAKEWHPEKNGRLEPCNVTCGIDTKVWWVGRDCEHEWDAPCYDRTKLGTGCPICSGHRVLKGFNDMWTSNPTLAKQLANPVDGYKYTQSSDKKVDWKCRECKSIVQNKAIKSINDQGLSCPECSDKVSFPEKVVYHILKQAQYSFLSQKVFSWSQGKRYDFYLPDYNWIIEVHGTQHYQEAFSRMGGRTLKEEQENDRFKKDLAIENGIDNYIVIDARHSTIEWIRDSLLSSKIRNIIGDIDFEKIEELSNISLIKEVCDMWNSETQNLSEIASLMNIHHGTVRTYLKKGAKIGWCDYCPHQASKSNGSSAGKRSSKSLIQLDKTATCLFLWQSSADAERSIGVNNASISFACRGKRKTAGGFKWMYKTDYDKMISDGLSHEEYMTKYYDKTK